MRVVNRLDFTTFVGLRNYYCAIIPNVPWKRVFLSIKLYCHSGSKNEYVGATVENKIVDISSRTIENVLTTAKKVVRGITISYRKILNVNETTAFRVGNIGTYTSWIRFGALTRMIYLLEYYSFRSACYYTYHYIYSPIEFINCHTLLKHLW